MILAQHVPSLWATSPFVAILLAIAILPLLRRTQHWWEHNSSKLMVAVLLAVVTLTYYYNRSFGVVVHHDEAAAEAATHGEPDDHADGDAEGASNGASDAHAGVTADHAAGHTAAGHDAEPVGDQPAASAHATAEHDAHEAHDAHPVHRSAPGWSTVWAAFDHAILKEYVPFIVLLFALYVIAGGIVVRGDMRATPLTNTMIIGTGGLLASFIGTTGAAMVLIRFLLKTNSERRYTVHTVVFFIFVVANIGGSLLPIGDPPLFLGYLRGVPFLWTMNLWFPWLFMLGGVLAIYYVWDTVAARRETAAALKRDREHLEPLRFAGMLNVLWLLGVVLAVATLDPGKEFPFSAELFGQAWRPPPYLREGVQLTMVALAWFTTAAALRRENRFNFVAIGEVACLFIGIFITMQPAIEILQANGAALGLQQPWHFFWATGILSSFLDNAPTYVVFFETAGTLPTGPQERLVEGLATSSGALPYSLLVAVSCGAVFMGANSYIGNGPNFMVKSIAEQAGVRMPSFFGYMIYPLIVLVPLFLVLTLIMFVNWG